MEWCPFMDTMTMRRSVVALYGTVKWFPMAMEQIRRPWVRNTSAVRLAVLADHGKIPITPTIRSKRSERSGKINPLMPLLPIAQRCVPPAWTVAPVWIMLRKARTGPSQSGRRLGNNISIVTFNGHARGRGKRLSRQRRRD